jgi:cell division protein FtsQ
MPRKQNGETAGARRDWRTLARYVFMSGAALACAVLTFYAWQRVDRFLTEDPRFRFRQPTRPGEESSDFRVEGVVHAPRARIVQTFTSDFGRSIYLMPVAERRRLLLAVDWVKDAAVSRQWPDRLVVHIRERAPVAFAQIPTAARASRMALIDEDGVLLDPPVRARFSLPVLTGIRREQPEPARRVRVRQALHLLDEASELRRDISEVNVANPDNLHVTLKVEGRAIVLMVGDHNFPSRIRNFLAHYPEIRKRLPNSVLYDLRLDDRITAVDEGDRLG